MELNQVDAARLRASLGAHLRSAAKKRQANAGLVRKQYVFTVFLGQLFNQTGAPWVLLGGNALLIRTGGGRFTQDIDLARDDPWESPEAVRVELQELVESGRGDSPFAFRLSSVTRGSEPDKYGYGAATANIKVEALLGGTQFDTFTIDITARRHLDAPVDQVPLTRVIEHPTLDNLPSVPTTPVENHLADKICALYETYGADGTAPSTRYRDLADAVRLIHGEAFEAERFRTVLDRETGRRNMALPAKISPPHEKWNAAFPQAAREFAEYPRELHSLDASLAVVGSCLDKVLSGEITVGRWEPATQKWA